MYLYYQDLSPDCEPEFIGEYDTIESMMLVVKEECDDGHETCPEDIPSYDEYLNGNFLNYPDCEFYFHIPTIEEIDNLQYDDYITIIKNLNGGDENMYLVSKVKY